MENASDLCAVINEYGKRIKELELENNSLSYQLQQCRSRCASIQKAWAEELAAQADAQKLVLP